MAKKKTNRLNWNWMICRSRSFGRGKNKKATSACAKVTTILISADNATQKRIDRLTKKMREAERQREEALKFAQGRAGRSSTA